MPTGALRTASAAAIVSSAIAAVLATACGDWLDRSPAVSTAALALNRSAVPLGAPLELTFRFDIAPDALPFAEDYRVMVHFVDANGELMWTDDHDPPTPTRQWQAGQTVTYSRRHFVPMYPYIGEASILVGLYSPTDGARLRLAGDHEGQRAYKVAVLTLEPQAESSFLTYGAGWHPLEGSAEGDGLEWRWTSAEAVLSFRHPHTDAVLYLMVDGRPDLFEMPQNVGIITGDRIIQSFPVDSTERTFHELALESADLGVEDRVELKLRVDKTFVPSQLPGHDRSDHRVLGVRVYYAFVEPRPGTGSLH